VRDGSDKTSLPAGLAVAR